MAYTPVELRHVALKKGLLGYKKQSVDQLLTDVVSSFEDVWRERADLADKVEQLESDLVRYRELESLLRTTLVSAERASAELKEQARREADLILSEAYAEARAVQRRARVEHEGLLSESIRLRGQLTAVLAMLDDDPPAEIAAEQAGDDEAVEPVEHAEQVEPTWHTLPDAQVLGDPDAEAA